MTFAEDQITSIDLVTNDILLDQDKIKETFLSFLEEFKLDSHYPYKLIFSDELVIQLDHLFEYDNQLSLFLIKNPLSTLKIFEDVLFSKYSRSISINLISSRNLLEIKELTSKYLNQTVRIEGIAVSSSSPFTKPTQLFLVCKICLKTVLVDNLPRNCPNNCGLDPFNLIPEKSKVIDCQYVKIQHNYQQMTLLLEERMVNKIIPGQSVVVTGILLSNTSLFVKVLGIEFVNSINSDLNFDNLDLNFCTKNYFRSIAPSIYGYDDVKKVLGCLLIGGVEKQISYTKTRGSINVLLLGDPGIAKSQFLKFISKVSPIGIYTSGKGCSAAGLTASVLKDSNGFYLEAGALVLSDGGICCIDEFDKMNENDRVSIHEAMEQQTISISKAGINAQLNCRCGVLAAANPVFGRYDEFKSPGENISFGCTILSRFDCIFLLKDYFSLENDKTIAQHILSSSNKELISTGGDNLIYENVMDIQTMKYFINHCKKRQPVFRKESKDKLIKFFVETRKKVRELTFNSKEKNIPITVRQLEAIIRLSEALAKINLRDEVLVEDVEESIRLFNVSTMNAVSQNYYLEGMVRPEFMAQIEKITESIQSILPVGSAKSFNAIVNHCKDYSHGMVSKAIDFLVKSGKVLLKDNNRVVVRIPQ